MKIKPFLFLAVLGLLFLRAPVSAQPFPIDTIIFNGPTAERINLVILGDGFTDAQKPRFQQQARLLVSNLMNQKPFVNYKAYFNAFSVFTSSVDSGVKHPVTAADCPGGSPVTNPNTRFGSSFDVGGTHRAVVALRTSIISSVLAQTLPEFDQGVVLVNSTIYGGTGGQFATVSLDPSAAEVINHEMGHSFGFLADEYWAGPQFAHECDNMTQDNDFVTNRWAPWLNYAGVSTYAFAEDPTWFHPHQNCKMKVLGPVYCSVCTEALVERIHSLVPPIKGFTAGGPAVQANADTCLTSFHLTLPLILPSPNTLKVKWQVGSVPTAGTGTLTVPCASLTAPGATHIQAVVQDTTKMVRRAGHGAHVYLNEWDVVRTTVGTRDIIEKQHSINFSLAPNPANGAETRVLFTTDQPIALSYRLISTMGATIWENKEAARASGDGSVAIPVQGLPTGLYSVQALHNGQVLWQESLVKN